METANDQILILVGNMPVIYWLIVAQSDYGVSAMKRALFWSTCWIALLPTIAFASYDWQFLTVTSKYRFDLSTTFDGYYPDMFADVKITPMYKFEDGALPTKLKPGTSYLVVFASVECTPRGETSYLNARFFDRKNRSTGKVTEYSPSLTGLDQFEEKMKAKLCRESPYEGPGRWRWIDTKGVGFQKLNVFLDSEGLPAAPRATVSFWWKAMPIYPVAYARLGELFDDPAETLDYTYTLVHSTALCPNKQIMNDEKQYYGTGRTFISQEKLSSTYENVIPDSLGEKLLRHVCAR